MPTWADFTHLLCVLAFAHLRSPAALQISFIMSIIHICSMLVTATNHFITLYNLFKAQLEKKSIQSYSRKHILVTL